MSFFNKITLKKWQQFDEVEIKFHDKLTMLTGANGSGKMFVLTCCGDFVGVSCVWL